MLEADSVVGGISRSAERDGWRFDIGGHRFFTKVRAVEDLWHEILPDEDFMLRPRMSRIYYQGKYFDYPLKAQNALSNLGPVEAARCVGSYVWARIRPPEDQDQSTRAGWRPASDIGCTGRSSRPTPRRCGASRPPSCPPIGRRSGSRTCRSRRRSQRPAPQAQPEGHHLADRGVPVPEIRPGDDVGTLPGQGRGGRHQGADEHHGQPDPPRRGHGRVGGGRHRTTVPRRSTRAAQ